MSASHDRSLALDGIRGIAAVAVLAFHGGVDLKLPWCVGHGWLAVDVFFVMSGFVVERAYGERLRNGWSAASFARVRIRRLYPLYLFGLTVGTICRIAVLVGTGRPIVADTLGISIVAGVLLLPILSGESEQVFPLNGPSWSLLVEAVANAAFAIDGRRSGRPYLLVVVGVAAATIAAAALMGMPLGASGRSCGLWLDFARGAFGFGVGAWMGLAFRTGLLGWVRRMPVALVFIALVAMLLVPRGSHDAWFDPLGILVLCPAIVLSGAVNRPTGRIARLCSRAGALSYPLYVVHAPILYAAHRLAPQGAGEYAQQALWTGAAGGMALALAWAIGRWSEPHLTLSSAAGVSAESRPMLTAADVRG